MRCLGGRFLLECEWDAAEGHRRGESREQAALFPVMLDELVPQDGLVRVVDAWVGGLDLKALGFQKAQAKAMGAPPYDPGDLLRLYVWGYLSAVRSSRELEKECHRNVECMWLLGRLAPDHKTIADFRRNNSNALVAVCAAFVQFARSVRPVITYWFMALYCAAKTAAFAAAVTAGAGWGAAILHAWTEADQACGPGC